ncbi:MAG: isoprenylcysteine carboxylmethyltransferase family protein [Chloroflexi bacterium]|nr:isoprenylcysteine carboxylmethyltransferase family protein [Chloroflexota bacterium]
MKVIAFGIGTALLTYFSRRSLRVPRSHGFYRFFAWECILGLFLLNVSFWFYKPLAWNQILAWVLLFASLIPLGFGVHFLRTQGRPAEKRESDSTLLAFEKTTTLVTSGIYKYIRHPLYSSLFLLAWGIFFKSPSVFGMALAMAATLFLIATAKADEAECIQFFGTEYQKYMEHTKRFIPFLF